MSASWRALAALLVLPLAACGLHPMYAGGAGGTVGVAAAGITVSPIEGKSGWLVSHALADELGSHAGAARYRLDVRLDEKLQGQGQLSNNSVTRERRTLRARFQLVDVTTGAILLDASADADAGIDVVSSEYAVIAAEQTALENLSHVLANRIATRVALRLRAGTP